MAVKEEKLLELTKEIPFKWKVQTSNEYNALCVAYIDARGLFDLLDEVVGPSNWSTDYMVVKDQMFCRLGVNIERMNGTTEWVYKMDTGVEANTEAEKSQVSDASKRVGIQWGAGRFLYNQDIQKLKTKKHTNNKFYPCDDKGNILWDGDELTNYINNKLKLKPQAQEGKILNEGLIPQKYVTPTKEPTYSKTDCKEETMKKVAALDKGGVKGKDCIKKYLADYNTAKKTDYKLADLNTDERLISVVDFINNIPPKV